MAEHQGHQCPQCGATRGPDNTPSCGCGRRASDALLQARTAEAAAAEDFDPLRIRPYVDLDAPDGTPAGAEPTQPLPTVTSEAPEAGEATGVREAGETGEALEAPVTPEAPEAPEAPTTALPAAALPTPLAPPPSPPSDHDLRLFEAADADPLVGRTADRSGRGRAPKRRRTVLLAASGAVVAVVAAAGLAAGLLSYDSPSRDDALPRSVREAPPEARTSEAVSVDPTSSPTPTGTASASPSSSPSASASPSASESASPSPSASSASPSASASGPADATPSPSASRDQDQGQDQGQDGGQSEDQEREAAPEDAPVLRRGDSGPEVAELQHRLRQLYLYNDDINGNFNRPVEDALRNYQWARGLQDSELGVYDQPTRAMLEAETSEP